MKSGLVQNNRRLLDCAGHNLYHLANLVILGCLRLQYRARIGVTMKKDIHPEYKLTKITCVCGNVIETRSTASDIHVEICSVCHPFYTGKQKLVDTAGRIDRFNKRYGIKADGK